MLCSNSQNRGWRFSGTRLIAALNTELTEGRGRGGTDMALVRDSYRPVWAVPRERRSHPCPGSGGLPAEAGLRLELWGDSPPRGGGSTPELQGVVGGSLERQPSPRLFTPGGAFQPSFTSIQVTRVSKGKPLHPPATGDHILQRPVQGTGWRGAGTCWEPAAGEGYSRRGPHLPCRVYLGIPAHCPQGALLPLPQGLHCRQQT